MFRNTISAVALISALGTTLVPVTALANGQDRDDRERESQEHRYYDNEHNDYHRWSVDEDRLYRQFLAERHMKYREFERLSAKDQRRYWDWRHDHEREFNRENRDRDFDREGR